MDQGGRRLLVEALVHGCPFDKRSHRCVERVREGMVEVLTVLMFSHHKSGDGEVTARRCPPRPASSQQPAEKILTITVERAGWQRHTLRYRGHQFPSIQASQGECQFDASGPGPTVWRKRGLVMPGVEDRGGVVPA
jgi:hypothetical protein